MYKRMTSYVLLFKAVFLIAFLTVHTDSLSAQSKYTYRGDAINSFSFSFSPLIPFTVWYELTEGIGQTYPLQLEYLRYKVNASNVGLGGGLAVTFHPTGELGYEHFTHYKFADIFGYGKLYLGDGGIKPYMDAKLGLSIALDKNIGFGCYSCVHAGPLYIRYGSGPMIQPGFGIDIEKSREVRYGFKLSSSFNFVRHQRDRHENGWKTTPTGIIKRDTGMQTLGSLFFGFYFYL